MFSLLSGETPPGCVREFGVGRWGVAMPASSLLWEGCSQPDLRSQRALRAGGLVELGQVASEIFA